jgi:hypothetical protein
MDAIAKPIAATAVVTLELLRLPRAEVSSDAATQAPRASFHMLLYDLFICCSTLGEWVDGSGSTKNAMRPAPGSIAEGHALRDLDYKNAGMYGLVYISVHMLQ